MCVSKGWNSIYPFQYTEISNPSIPCWISQSAYWLARHVDAFLWSCCVSAYGVILPIGHERLWKWLWMFSPLWKRGIPTDQLQPQAMLESSIITQLDSYPATLSLWFLPIPILQENLLFWAKLDETVKHVICNTHVFCYLKQLGGEFKVRLQCGWIFRCKQNWSN